MNKLTPPSHIMGQMAHNAPESLKAERAKWIMAQFDANFTARQIGVALQISAVSVRQATIGFREAGKMNLRSAEVGLPRADWEDTRPVPRHETDPRFTLVRPAPRDEPDRIAVNIATIRKIHAKFMAEINAC